MMHRPAFTEPLDSCHAIQITPLSRRQRVVRRVRWEWRKLTRYRFVRQQDSLIADLWAPKWIELMESQLLYAKLFPSPPSRPRWQRVLRIKTRNYREQEREWLRTRVAAAKLGEQV